MLTKLRLLPAAITILVLDQVTKRWALSELPGQECESGSQSCVDVFLGLRFRLAFNEGAAFSTGQNAGQLIGALAFVIIGILIYMATQRSSLRSQLIIGVLVGGAGGNLADRIFRADGDGILSGAVIDFIDLGWWPVFNIADIAIVVGAIAAVFFLGQPDEAGSGETENSDEESAEAVS